MKVKNKLSTREFLYNTIFYNSWIKKILVSLLNSNSFVDNPLYRFLNKNNIVKIIKKYYNKPNFVFIENTNLCNSNCVVCPHYKMRREQGIMGWNLYKKIIDQCREINVENISLHGFGEPFIDKGFIKKLAYAKAAGFKHVGTSTNGSLLNKKISDQLVNLKLDEINFSLDASSRKVYEQVRKGLPYDKVMDNVYELIDIRDKLKKNKPKIIVDFIETKYNQQEKNDFVNKWSKIVDSVNITTLHSWGGKFKDKAGKNPFHFRSNGPKDPCRFLWTDMYVNWDGKVTACCQDFESELVIGNISQNSVDEIWKGEKLNNLRKLHLEGRADEISLCRKCDYRSVWWLFK